MSSSVKKVDLKLDWCSYEAAKYAVMNWHYSKAMPCGKTIKIGVWENSKFIGVVIFSRGANNNLGKPYGLPQTEICELARVALYKHIVPVTKIISIAINLLKESNLGLRLIVSFADDRQKHLGIIYQAGNWIYTGYLKSSPEYLVRSKWVHQRTAGSLLGTIKNLKYKRDGGGRYRYLMPLDKNMREEILPLQKPYPKADASVGPASTPC